MIIKNGKKVIGVSKGDTPIPKIYKGDKLVFSTLIDFYNIKPSEALVCDVVFVNKETEKLTITRKWNTRIFPPDTYKPIGVVVIPGTHGVLKDGTGKHNQCGILGLVNLKLNNGDSLVWGPDTEDITNKGDGLGRYDSITDGLLNYNKRACDVKETNKSTQLRDSSTYLPVQKSIKGPATWKGSYYIPSPYSNDNLLSGEYNP